MILFDIYNQIEDEIISSSESATTTKRMSAEWTAKLITNNS